ncbi:MAG: hypothetical protein QXL85_07070 [Candidatus Bathyarchaeia archaeon]
MLRTENQTTPTFEEGLTINSILAIIYAAVVLQPAAIYLFMTAGISIGAGYVVVLLFVELARILFRPLKKAEVFIIYYMGGLAATLNYFISMPWNAYIRTSPISRSFHIGEKTIADLIPLWMAPRADSIAIVGRTIFHPDWVPNLLVWPITIFILTPIMDIMMGFLAAHLYIEIEKLPFPLQQIDAMVIETLSEREPKRIRVFTVAALIGIAYGFILYGLPILSETLMGTRLSFLPLPWLDLTASIERYLPGSSLGISTDLTAFLIGWVIPFEVVVSMFIGSFALNVIGNHLLLKFNVLKVGEDWFPNMGIAGVTLRFQMKFWASVFVGLSVAIALVPLVRKKEYIISTFRSLSKISESSRRAGYLPLKIILAGYLAASFASIGIFYVLVSPEFRVAYWWFPILLGPGWTFIVTLVAARSIGLTGYNLFAATGYGYTASPAYIKEGILLSLPYQGLDAWAAPLAISQGGASWCAAFKLCQLTGTKPASFIKAWFLTVLISFITSMLYMQMFWSLAPIPSSSYPYLSFQWPITLLFWNLWVTKSIVIFQPMIILFSFFVGAIMDIIPEIIRIPFSPIGFIVGASTPVPSNISSFVGAIVGHYFIRKRLGEEWWKDYRYVVLAGVFLGEALVVGIAATIMLMSKAAWILPF